MREIKFSFLLRLIEGRVKEKILTLQDLFESNRQGFMTDILAIREYTGLTDKNGVEIYEGDLISEYKGIVIFFDGAFYVKHVYGAGWGKTLLSEWIKKRERAGVGTEIMGNIYENPELLKADKT